MNQRTRKKCVFIKATSRCPSPNFLPTISINYLQGLFINT